MRMGCEAVPRGCKALPHIDAPVAKQDEQQEEDHGQPYENTQPDGADVRLGLVALRRCHPVLAQRIERVDGIKVVLIRGRGWAGVRVKG